MPLDCIHSLNLLLQCRGLPEGTGGNERGGGRKEGKGQERGGQEEKVGGRRRDRGRREGHRGIGEIWNGKRKRGRRVEV